MKQSRFSKQQFLGILKEAENAQLKKLLAYTMIDNADLKNLLSKKCQRLPPGGKGWRIGITSLMAARGGRAALIRTS